VTEEDWEDSIRRGSRDVYMRVDSVEASTMGRQARAHFSSRTRLPAQVCFERWKGINGTFFERVITCGKNPSLPLVPFFPQGVPAGDGEAQAVDIGGDIKPGTSRPNTRKPSLCTGSPACSLVSRRIYVGGIGDNS
jgi:hypothetical protein